MNADKYLELLHDTMYEKILRVMVDPDIHFNFTDRYETLHTFTPNAILPSRDEWNRLFHETISENQEIPRGYLRTERNQMLLASDMYALPDYPHKSEEDKQAWLTYRQELRDVMNTISDDMILEMDPVYVNVTNFTLPSPPQ